MREGDRGREIWIACVFRQTTQRGEQIIIDFKGLDIKAWSIQVGGELTSVPKHCDFCLSGSEILMVFL